MTMKDGREFECNLQDEGAHYTIVRRGISMKVAKADVKSVRRAAAAPTQPSTQSTTGPAADAVERG
ncbi:MAG TPA: hypothetical protein VGR35_00275 [Tepidisphaeraceae bacterium]|nr:hypothetical protein [Tepidisphaeraceae bacterium]